MTINERTKVSVVGLRQFFKELDFETAELWSEERVLSKFRKIKTITNQMNEAPKSFSVGSQILFEALKENKPIELMVNNLETIDITPPS